MPRESIPAKDLNEPVFMLRLPESEAAEVRVLVRMLGTSGGGLLRKVIRFALRNPDFVKMVMKS